MAKLDSPERSKILPPEDILRAFDLSEGETIVDVGAGIGFFSFPAASMVGPSGRVIAIDTSREMVEELSRRYAGVELKNLEIHISDGYDFGVDSGTADFVLIAAVLHEVDDKPRFLKEALRVLKPGGRIGIVEWHAIETGRGPRLEDRLKPAETDELLRGAGFSSIQGKILNDFFYLVRAAV